MTIARLRPRFHTPEDLQLPEAAQRSDLSQSLNPPATHRPVNNLPLREPIVLAFTISEAVAIAGVGRSSLYKAIAAGHLPARKLGRRTLVMADDLRAWLQALPRLRPSKADVAGTTARHVAESDTRKGA
jgi:excisionase family DNA binding protein